MAVASAGSPGQWNSRGGFLLAAIGFAVGLGNIWRFPYVTGENGGSAFVLIYLLCTFAIGVPILMAELALGRRGEASPPRALVNVARAGDLNTRWSWLGYLNVLTAFAILIVYGVVAGWVLHYLYIAIGSGFAGSTAITAVELFDAVLAQPILLIFWATIALSLAGGIISAGVSGGIERAVKILMPTLFLLLLVLMVYNIFAGGMPATLSYLFEPDFSKITGATFLAALSQAFFSIGVAMAGMMIFGSYLPKDVSIGRSAIIIVAADTAVALVAGLVIFPMVFHNQLDVAAGTGLIFQTLPVAFAQMWGGQIVAALFFLLLSVAAITSIVGLMEPISGTIAEEFGCSRRRAAFASVASLLPFCVISALSFNHWQPVEMAGRSLANWLDYVPNQLLLPVGGLLIAVFVGWRVPVAISKEELGLTAQQGFAAWFALMRWLVVPAVLLILVTGL